MFSLRPYLLSLLLVALVSPAFAAAPLAPPKQGGVYVVAHRGAHIGIPENTLAAYQKAIDLGADFVEIDLRTTKDGALVSVHNSTVDAYTKDAAGKVEDFTLAELRALDIGSRVGPEWAEERIPTFEEILALCKGKIGIYLDFKNAKVGQTLEVIRKYDMEEHIVWYASYRELDEVKELCPTCIPMPDPGPEKLLPKLLERFPDVAVVASVWKYYSPAFVKQCHDAGAMVIVDESDASCWEEALAWGSDGIQTDDPEALIALLKARAERAK